jgi:hypothetical protein
MMLASLSAWRLRAVARLLLARRAVALSEPAAPQPLDLHRWVGSSTSPPRRPRSQNR